MSYVCKVNLGSVRKKFIRTTLTSEPATLQIYPLVNIEIKSTHRRYTIVTFDSVNPIYISSIPITVAILKKPIVMNKIDGFMNRTRRTNDKDTMNAVLNESDDNEKKRY